MMFNHQDPMRIQHLTKVNRFAQLIGRMEKLGAHTQFVTEYAALVHDIGIWPAEEKYGRSDGKLQEQDDTVYARIMLEELDIAKEDIERRCYLVRLHHTYTDINGIDYQILVEANFLVNFYEDALGQKAIKSAFKNIFCTASGKRLCEISYIIE